MKGCVFDSKNNIITIIIIMITIKIIIIRCRQKTQDLVHLSFNLTFQLNNGLSSDLQKLLKYFIGIAVVAFLKIQFA